SKRDWSSDVCSSDLGASGAARGGHPHQRHGSASMKSGRQRIYQRAERQTSRDGSGGTLACPHKLVMCLPSQTLSRRVRLEAQAEPGHLPCVGMRSRSPRLRGLSFVSPRIEDETIAACLYRGEPLRLKDVPHLLTTHTAVPAVWRLDPSKRRIGGQVRRLDEV